MVSPVEKNAGDTVCSHNFAQCIWENDEATPRKGWIRITTSGNKIGELKGKLKKDMFSNESTFLIPPLIITRVTCTLHV